jgi:hypothetical protein
MTTVSTEALRRVIAMATSHVEDIESGISEGLYVAAENDVVADRAAINAVEKALNENAALLAAPAAASPG